MATKRIGLHKIEYNKLNRLFKNVEKSQRQLVDGLMDNAAYALSEMMKCREKLDEDGAVVLFKNGKQEYLKKHPSFDVYTKHEAQYLSIMKELKVYLPQEMVVPLVTTKNIENPIDKMMGNMREEKLRAVK